MVHGDYLHRKFQQTRDINYWHAYKDTHERIKGMLKTAEINYVQDRS